jgi:DNA-binding winged helix-turn-helix (wHTH) protein/TolB-like protein
MRVVACRKRLAVFASFEFDRGTLELKKNGTRLRLEHKPATALACMLEHPGDVIERAELIRLLWPEESHGDFDHRLNKVINKIRFALGDDASSPRFIQTLSRRGYRFMEDVQIVEEISSNGMSPAADSETESHNPKNAAFPTDPSSSGSKRAEPILKSDPVRAMHWWRTRSPFPQVVIVTLVVGILFGAGAKLWSFATLAKARRSIVVETFRNVSGDPDDAWLSTALADWLTTDLSAGDQLRAVPLDKVARAEKELESANRDPSSPETLSVIRKNLGSDLVISGSYATVPGTAANFRLDVRLQDARNGKTLQSLSLVGTKLEALRLALDAGAKLRSVLGPEPLSSRGLGVARTALR